MAREHVSESEFKVLQALRRALERHLDGRPAADDTTIVVQKIIDGISSAEDQQISIRA